MRVPRAIRVPGRPDAVVAGQGGNIDILPTVLDLLGKPPRPEHRGRSLLPSLRHPEIARERPLYLTSGLLDTHAIVTHRSELAYAPATGVYHRYDLEADPGQRRKLFGQDPGADRAIGQILFHRNPALLERELGDPENRKLLERRLAEAGAFTSLDDLGFLLGLGALHPFFRASPHISFRALPAPVCLGQWAQGLDSPR